jgi:16S rRNA C967 or C1407 C5-methylase (RsmB/RsmF family)
MPETASALDRYRPIVGDWDAFLDAVRRPLPPCIWIRPDRGTDLPTVLSEDGLTGTPFPWLPEGLHLDAEPVPGSSLAYRAGLFHVMEEVSMVPVRLLDPRPGERVLDLCAAPGNKTVLIAARMRGTGTVVANDASRGRQAVTHTALHRMGLANVTLTAESGADPGWRGAGFDRVLVDAPCSCEGTVRKHPQAAGRTSASARRQLVRLQTALLSSAVDACRPGGRVVYATCTFAPEENESVVADVLAARAGDVRLVPACLGGLAHDPGLAEWSGRRYPAEMRHALRIWPQAGDTGGFFCAVLERRGDTARRDGPHREAWGLPSGHESVRETIEGVCDRFGLGPDLVDTLLFRRDSPSYVSAMPRDHDPGIPFRSLSTGLTAIRVSGAVPRLTTQGAIAFGPHVARNAVDLDRERALAFVVRRNVPVEASSSGHVLVRWLGHALGVGLARGAGTTAVLESLFPRAWAGIHPETLSS